MRSRLAPQHTSLVAAVTIIALVGIGAVSGVDSAKLADGTASVDVVSTAAESLEFESGRFGSGADYLRLPDAVVEVTSRSGTPRIYYRITVPALGVDRHGTRLIRREGRLRVPLPDVAYPAKDGPEPGTYTGRVVVEVQSFATDAAVLNRSIRVRVPA